MEKLLNPFQTTGYSGPEYFCDRKDETGLLRKYIRNKQNVTLFAIRRLGKTGLIHHVFHSFRNSRDTACIYLDILSTRNFQDFTNQLATAVYRRFPENKSIGKKISGMLKLLRPLISFNTLSGEPELSFDFKEARQNAQTIEQILSFLDSQNINIVIAIDEFQQILEYPEKNTEALLRTYMQNLKNTRFIFCGSNQKIMHEIFNDAKRPFFASCTNMHLDYIDPQLYHDFILEMFKWYKRKISPEAVSFILDWTFCHTYYTQFFCNMIFATRPARIQLEDARSTAAHILKLHENTFFQYRSLLTSAQWDLLTAVAKEEKLFKAHSKSFIQKYKLGGSSLVTRGMDALKEKQMICHHTNKEKPWFEVYDKFLLRWLRES